MALAGVAGFLDAYGISRYGTYLSFMSGNTTQVGLHIGRQEFTVVPPLAVGILGFVCGSFLGAYFAKLFGGLTRRPLLVAIAAATVLVMGFGLAGLPTNFPSIAILSIAMGAMNSSLPSVGAEAVNLTFVTGTLRRLGVHLALGARGAPLSDSQGAWDTHGRRALLLAGIWAGFFLGALLSGALTPPAGAFALLVPIVALLVLAVGDRRPKAGA